MKRKTTGGNSFRSANLSGETKSAYNERKQASQKYFLKDLLEGNE